MELYESLYESLPKVCIIIDSAGTILDTNQFTREQLGYSSQVLVGKPICHIFHPDDAPQLQSLLSCLANQSANQSEELRQLGQDGTTRWVRVSIRVLQAGRADASLLWCEDLTELRCSQEVVREKEDQLRLLANALTGKVSYVDREQRFLFVSRHYEEWSLIPPEKLLGKTIKEFVGTSGYGQLQNYLESALAGNQVSYEYTATFKDGKERHIIVTYVPHFNEQGEVLGLFVVCQDLTERRQTEFELRSLYQQVKELNIGLEAQVQKRTSELQEKMQELQRLNQLKDDFLSTVSHELRTPLTNMKMAIQMLTIALGQNEASVHWDKASRYLQILQSECGQETRLINNLLDLQSFEIGSQPKVLEQIHLPTWVPQVIEPFRERMSSSQQLLRLEMPSVLPPLVSDLSILGRLLAELLNNACKYTPAGEQITVTVRDLPGLVQLQVINSGVEIPAEHLSRIFEKFYRVPQCDHRQQGGTGLGLALVQRLVELLDGKVWVESQVGQTSFTIELPTQSC